MTDAESARGSMIVVDGTLKSDASVVGTMAVLLPSGL